jgi:hypothetical protein
MRTFVLAASLAAPLLASAADLVTNGSFEADAQANGSWAIYNSLTGWMGPGIELRDNVAGTAFDGSNFVELDSNKNSSMSQTLTGIAGQYVLSFWYSARPNTAPGTNGLSFSLDGSTLGSVLVGVGNSSSTHSWQQYSTLVDFDGSAALTFSAIELGDSYGGSLDKVSFTAAVPEPQTYALMLAGLGAMGLIMSRRNRA